MNKEVFLETLESRLQGIKPSERQEALSYYLEIIEDSMEEGKSEVEVIQELGHIDEIVKKVKENSEGPIYNDKIETPEKNRPMMLILLSPLIFIATLLYGSLLLAAYSFLIALYIVFFSFELAGALYLFDSFLHFGVNLPYGVFEIGMSLFLLGLGYFTLMGASSLWKLLNQGVKVSWNYFMKALAGGR